MLQSVKISELPSADTLTEDDLIVIDQPDDTKKATLFQVLNHLEDVVEQSVLAELAQPDGLKNIGRVANISSLRAFEPVRDKQQIEIICHTSIDTSKPYQIESGGKFQADFSDTTTADDNWLCIVTTGGKRWKRIINNTLLNLAWAGVKDGDDYTAALKRAISYVKSIFISGNAPAFTPAIAINAGKYIQSETIEKPPFVKLVFLGSVDIDASPITSGNIFDIFNDASIPKPSFSGPGMNGEDISCIGGTLTITGNAKAANGVTGIIYGNKAANFAPCRGVGFRNVIVKNCGIGLAMRTYDTYLLTFSDSRLEQNYNNFVVPAPASTVNSGEATILSNIIFGGAGGAQIYINAPSQEFIFDKCKGDYAIGDLIKIGPSCSFSSLKFTNFRCEEFRGDFVTGTPSALGNVNVFFTNLTILPRPNGNSSEANSPSRKLFSHTAGINIAIDGLEIFSEIPPYTDSLNISEELGGSLRISGYIPREYRYLTGNNYIMNRGHTFDDEVVGAVLVTPTPVNLTRFTVDSLANASGSVISLDGGKAIQMTGSSSSSVVRIVSEFMPVQSGNIIAVAGAVQKLSATGNLNGKFVVLWYDKDSTLISNSSESVYDFNAAYSNTALPNYADGNSRKLTSPGYAKTAPRGAAFARVRMEISGFVGTINLINLLAFKAL